MAERSARVRLEAIVGPFQSAMASASRSVHKLAADVSAMEKSANRDMRLLGEKTRNLGIGMTAGITAPYLLFAKTAIDTAGRANEALNRNRVVFGKHADEVEAWSEGSAKSMGLARHEAISTASTFANMFTEMGLGDDTARQMSMRLVELAADVGSFRDVDPSDMLVRMRAGVVGEYEPLRNMGIVLTDVAVRNEAVRLGLAGTREEATASALVQARYSLILQQTSKDQGDYARTAGEAVNAQRTATAAYKDAMAELGDNLLPLVAKGALTFADMAAVFGELPEGAQSAILAFGGMAAAIGPVLIVTGSLIRNIDLIRKTAPGAASALGKIGAIGGVAFATFTIFKNIAEIGRDSGRTFDDMVSSFARTSGELDDGARAALAAHLEVKGLTEAFAEAGVTVDDLYEASKRGMGGVTELGRRVKESSDLSGGQFQALGGFVNALEMGAEKGKAMNAVLGDQAFAAGEASEGIDDLVKELDDYLAKQFAAEEAGDRFNETLLNFADRVRAAQIEGDGLSTSLSDMTLQGLENRATLRDLASGIVDVITQMREQGRSEQEIAATSASMRESLIYTLTQLGFNRAEVERYIGVITQIPGNAHTAITADASQARSEIASVINALTDLQRKQVSSMIRQAHGLEPLDPNSWTPVPQANQSTWAPPAGLNTILSGGGPASTSARGNPQAEADAVARYLEEQWMQRMEQVKNRFHEGQATLDEYQRSLDEQMAREVPWTDRWVALQKEKADAARYWPDAVKSYLEGVYEHRKMIEDNMYELEVISKDKYLKILEDRLKGLEKYSDAWMAVYRQIQELEGKALESQLKMMEAFDRGREWQRKWMELADQRALSKSWELALNATAMTPAGSAGSSSVDNSRSYSPQFTVMTSDPAKAAALTNQKMRDGALLAGV
jgi:hypothetical protein